jgi:hypothetical protein
MSTCYTAIYKAKACLHISIFKVCMAINTSITWPNLSRKRENWMETFILSDHVQTIPNLLNCLGLYIHTHTITVISHSPGTHTVAISYFYT